MGLRDTIQKAVDQGLAALGDVRESVTYYAWDAAASVYDADTGNFTRAETAYPLDAVFTSYRNRDIDGEQIKPRDEKALIGGLVLTVTPQVTDRILRSDGTYWHVMDVKRDPAQAMWTLQVRGQ